MESINKISLPFRTNALEDGPVITFRDDHLVMKYDNCEHDMVWIKIDFTEVLKYCYTQMCCCQAEQLVGSDSIVVCTNSMILNDAIKEWEISVGWQEWQKKKGGASRFKHYRIFFDDVGCFDVIASDYKVKNEPMEPMDTRYSH
jgi:hypothetical protein